MKRTAIVSLASAIACACSGAFWSTPNCSIFAQQGVLQLSDPIKAIESKNNFPIIVGRSVTARPLFDDAFDWEDQAKVSKAIRDLSFNADRYWAHITESLGNRRYSITYDLDTLPRNYSVGDICAEIVTDTLTEVFADDVNQFVEEHKLSRRTFSVLELIGGIRLDVWCDDRKERPLFELQYEMCQYVIAAISRESDIDKSEREALIARIQRKAEAVRKSKTPKLPAFMRGREVGLYSPDRAKKIRDGLRSVQKQ